MRALSLELILHQRLERVSQILCFITMRNWDQHMARGKPEKYIGLAAEIRRMIQDEKMKPNTLLPSERTMSAHIEVKHLT